MLRFLSQSEEREHYTDDHDEPNDIDNSIHVAVLRWLVSQCQTRPEVKGSGPLVHAGGLATGPRTSNSANQILTGSCYLRDNRGLTRNTGRETDALGNPPGASGGFFSNLHAATKRSMTEQRKAHRVVFEKGYSANMMAIDGTWRRPCTMEDVSDSGAKLTVDGSVEGLAMKEFFLLLSSMGTAYRRCELAWVNGNQIGVYFIKSGAKKKKTAALV